jgi:hypothetical protein
MGVRYGTGTRHGRWEKPCVDAPREPVARERFAERAVPHAQRADAHAEAEGARGDVGGVFQRLESILLRTDYCKFDM